MSKKVSILVAVISGLLLLGLSAYGQTLSISDLKKKGVSGFPQAKAKVLVDTEDLKVSILNDAAYLAVQTIVWKDDSNETATNTKGQLSGDYSVLLTAVEDNGKRKPKVDRTYTLNPWPSTQGLYYQIYSGRVRFTDTLPDGTKRIVESEAESALKSDTTGRGKIEYITVERGRKIRVDTMLIPLTELNKKPGDRFWVCYYVSSPAPKLKFNSCGYDPGKDYASLSIPFDLYQKIVLENATADILSKLIGTVSPYPAIWFAPINDPKKPDWEILPQEATAGEVILSKRNELGILSNFAATPFELDGKRYASVEGFWQMMLYPEGPDDERAKNKGVTWKYTREQVAQMTGFEAKAAGTLAEENMKKLGIDWVTFKGKRFPYRSHTPADSLLRSYRADHYRLILAAMRAKLEQNPEVKRILLATGDLILKPDHIQERNAPREWKYNEIWMQLRSELQNAK